MAKLPGEIQDYIGGNNPSHSVRRRLHEHILFLRKEETAKVLTEAGYLTVEGKVSKKAQLDGLVDTCEGKVLWNLKKTKRALLDLTRKESKRPATVKPITLAGGSAPPVSNPAGGPIWTDLENIGTYFGVGKNKIGAWLEQLGLRGFKPRQVNESGDLDMLDIANESKEKFRAKVPTEKALELGYARIETVEYRGKGGKEKSFDKEAWDREKVKNVLVQAGHPLDTERKLLLKGKGKNSSVTVSSIDTKVDAIYAEWRKQFRNPATRKTSWKLFERQPTGVIQRVEMRLGYPRFIQDKLYLDEANLDKIIA